MSLALLYQDSECRVSIVIPHLSFEVPQLHEFEGKPNEKLTSKSNMTTLEEKPSHVQN